MTIIVIKTFEMREKLFSKTISNLNALETFFGKVITIPKYDGEFLRSCNYFLGANPTIAAFKTTTLPVLYVCMYVHM
jgi:hypothetical protein